MRTFDRYVFREALAPFALALLVLTFVLIIPFIIAQAETMIAKGVPWLTVARVMVTLLPQALGLTLPMSTLVALMVALGRLSGDREVIAMMACGLSPLRLLRPAVCLAVVTWAATSWIMLSAIPDANQTFREITTRLVADRAEGEVKPRVFFEDFPGFVVYVRDVPEAGGWSGVVAADTRTPDHPVIYLAERGRMLVDRAQRTIQMVLTRGTRHSTSAADPDGYEVVTFEESVLSLDPESVFPRTGPARGEREMTIPQLRERADELVKAGDSPHNPLMEIHKKFSIPAACFVFALVAVALGGTHRRDGKLVTFALGLGVIFVYYAVMWLGQALAKGIYLPPWLAMWLPNVLLGGAGIVALWGRTRGARRTRTWATPLPHRWLAANGVRGRAVISRIPGPHVDAPDAPGPVRRDALPSCPRTRPGGHGRAVLHLHVHRSVGQVDQGDGQHRDAAAVLLVGHAPVHVLRHRDGRVDRRRGDDRSADQEQRARSSCARAASASTARRFHCWWRPRSLRWRSTRSRSESWRPRIAGRAS